MLFMVNFAYAKDEIKRKILVLYDKNQEMKLSNVHTKLESILNYYGYYCEYFSDTLENAPKDISSYAGVIYWSSGLEHENPVKLLNYITKFKNKKNILIGNIPYTDKNGKDYLTTINQLLKENFGFYFGYTWAKSNASIKRNVESSFFNYEKKLSFLNKNTFLEIILDDKSIRPIFTETFNSTTSASVFLSSWGFYGQADKVFYYDENPKEYRWIINPYKLIESVYETHYPIPDTTTKKGKRIAYIHVDGDGILSKAFNNKYTIENGYDFIKKSALKTGVSYITIELDAKGPVLKKSNLDATFFNEMAKKTLSLPLVEPASHTYTHPFNWREGEVAYSVNKNAKIVLYEGHIKAYQEKNKQINIDYEITDSINYLQRLIPQKKIQTLYWTGDCYPSIRDLKFIDKNNLLAFNGGDSRYDLEYNSLSYVTPLSLYSKDATQIYSSNSNENTYTNNWTESFWRYKNVIKTFENTGYPKRIKPVNVYYHFYSFEKKASFLALKKVYAYLNQNHFEYIYPSEFIKIAQNFHTVKIEKDKNYFYISNIKTLKEFRLKGNIDVETKGVSSIYNKDLNETYIRVEDNISNIKIKAVYNE